MNFNKNELATKISILYYENNMSQNEIAKKIKISRSYVSQLIKYAKETGIVKVSINFNNPDLRLFRDELEFKLLFPDLQNVFIMYSKSKEFTENNIGKFASQHLYNIINEAKIIGINLGKSVEKTINNIKTSNLLLNDPNKKIIQIMGGFTNYYSTSRSHPNTIVDSLCSILNGQCYFLDCPSIVEQPKLRNSLLKENSIKNVIKFWDNIDLAIMGIGEANEKSNLFKILNQKMIDLITKSGACCELTINFFDENGNYIPLIDKYKISINYKQLKKVKTKVLITHGKYKAKAIISALKANMIDVLITDSITINSIKKSLKIK